MVPVFGTAEEDAIIESLASNGLVEAGQVVVISIDAIRERVGARWPMRQPTVWEFAQREFRRQFTPRDQLLQLNDGCYMLVQPGQIPSAAQGRAINFLRDLLQFFLGESAKANIRVGRVVGVRDGEVLQEPLTPQEFDLAERAAPRADMAGDGPLAGVATVAAGGARNFAVRFSSDPIWSRKKNAIVSYRLKPDVYERLPDDDFRPVDVAQASTREIVGIDLIVLEEALNLLDSAEPNAKFGLHAPLHISTMNSSLGRQAVFARLSAAPKETSGRLAICLEGLGGAPRFVLDTAVATLLPFVLGVVGQAPDLEFDPRAWRGARLSAIACDLATLRPGPGLNLPEALARFAASAESVAGSLIAHGISTRAEALAAWAADFAVLSGPFLGEKVDALRPIRFEAADLYRQIMP
jgi:hypothetical protein